MFSIKNDGMMENVLLSHDLVQLMQFGVALQGAFYLFYLILDSISSQFSLICNHFSIIFHSIFVQSFGVIIHLSGHGSWVVMGGKNRSLILCRIPAAGEGWQEDLITT